MNEALQYIAVGIALLVCVVWVFRRVKRRSTCRHDGCGGCGSCPLSEKCDDAKKRYL